MTAIIACLRSIAAALLPIAAAVFLAACGPDDVPIGEPALYRIDAADLTNESGEPAGWLFGTIHALPSGTRWRSAKFDRAVATSGALIVEVADLDETAAQTIFAQLSRDPALPPLPQRVAPEYRDDLAEVLKDTGTSAAQFRQLESWAVALTLSSMVQAQSGSDSSEGVDKAIIADYPSDRIIGLETVAGQLTMFDRLPDPAQQALLESLLRDAQDDPAAMTQAWLNGDIAALAGFMDAGLGGTDGGDTGLRTALLTRRNAAWADPIGRALTAGQKPFIAVGAGHLGGGDGLIALLKARGWRVTRVQ